MDVNEIIGLSRWIEQWVRPALGPYEKLVAALEQNANSTSKVPLRELLDDVQRSLESMPVGRLTQQQAGLLKDVEAYDLLGQRGWRFIERTVKEGNYDPATAAAESRKAKQVLNKLVSLFNSVRDALKKVLIEGEHEFESTDNLVTVRVRFEGGVSVNNVTDLRKWSAEWFEIARGISMAVDEKPEDILVRGASTGSLILILGTTLTVATILALIMKQVASTVKSVAEIANMIADLRMKRLLDSRLENALNSTAKEIEKNGVDETLSLVKKELDGRINNEVEGGLKKSIEKLFDFSAKGGEVDMLPPPSPEPDNDNSGKKSADVSAAIDYINDAIEEMRNTRASTQLLIEDQTEEKSIEDK